MRFPRPGKLIPDKYAESVRMNNKRKRKEVVVEDIKREQALLDFAKMNFNKKKNEFLRFLAQSSSYATQVLTSKHILLLMAGCQ